MNTERRKGIALAEKHGLSHAAQAIRDGKCYQDIFNAAINESSLELVSTIVAESKDPEWNYYAVRYIPGLTEAQKERHLRALAESKDPYWNYYAAFIPGLTEAQKERHLAIAGKA